MKDEDYLRMEFIGCNVKVVDAPDPGIKGIEGIIVDETKNTFKIKKPDGRVVVVPKKGTWFEILLEGKRIKVYGDIILTQSHKRIKKRYPKKYKYRW